MIADIELHRDELRELCRRFGVRRLSVFGSAARGSDFDPTRSDIDFLVEFASQDIDFARFVDFKEALETVLDRRVDLVDRKAIEVSRNYIRRRHILTGAEPVYAA
jgi:predicted nucleotidyltransferase